MGGGRHGNKRRFIVGFLLGPRSTLIDYLAAGDEVEVELRHGLVLDGAHVLDAVGQVQHQHALVLGLPLGLHSHSATTAAKKTTTTN